MCPVPPDDCPFGYFTGLGFGAGVAGGLAAGLLVAAPTAETAAPLTVPPAVVIGAAAGSLIGLVQDVKNHRAELGRILRGALTGILIGVGAAGPLAEGVDEETVPSQTGAGQGSIPVPGEGTVQAPPPGTGPDPKKKRRPDNGP